MPMREARSNVWSMWPLDILDSTSEGMRIFCAFVQQGKQALEYQT